MKLTIKVKHLVIGLLAAAATLLLYTGYVEPKVRTHFAEREFKQGAADAKATMLRAIDDAPSQAERWRLIREYMIETGADTARANYDIVIGPGTTYSSSSTTLPDAPIWTAEEKMPYLDDYVRRAPVNGYMTRAARQLAAIHIGRGDADAAIAALAAAEGRLGGGTNDYERGELMLERAKLIANKGDVRRSFELLDELTAKLDAGQRDLSGRVAALKAELHVRQGDVAEAYDQVERELAEYKAFIEDEKEKYPEKDELKPVMIEQLTQLRDLLRASLDKGEPGVVTGTVKRSDGTPLAGVGVFLRHRNDVHHSLIEGEPYQTVTDAEGRYRFDGVLPDSYALHIGVKFEQIDGWTWPVDTYDRVDVGAGDRLDEDVTLRPLMNIVSPSDSERVTGSTIRFRWEPVEGAATYRITVNMPLGEGGSVGMVLRDRYRGTELTLATDDFYDQVSGISYDDVDGKLVPNAAALLGFANPDSRYFWSVEALDAKGDPMTRSNGYRLNESTIGRLPFFYVKERTLTPEDRLLLDGKLEEALNGYRAAAAANGEDRHSLRMIVRLYEALASADRRPMDDAALPYLLRMIELHPEEPYLFKAFDYYYERENWQQANRMFAKLEQAPGGVNGYTASVYATALMRQNRLSEAENWFAKAMELDDSHRYVGSYAAIRLYVSGRIADAMETAAKYPERELNPYGPVWTELLADLDGEAEAADSRDAYMQELRGVLERVFAGEREAVKRWAASAEHEAMERFVSALLEVD